MFPFKKNIKKLWTERFIFEIAYFTQNIDLNHFEREHPDYNFYLLILGIYIFEIVSLYETKDGEFTGKIIDINDDLKFRIGSKEIHHLLKYNLRYDEYIPYGSNLDHWMERRVMIRNKDIDKFMFTEPFESKRIEILNHLFYHSNDKSEYIEDCPKTYKLLKKTIDNKLSDR